jgi:type VI secretion system protein ImpC
MDAKKRRLSMPNTKGLEFEFDLGEGTEEARRRRPSAIRILAMGDFTGRPSEGVAAGESRIDERPIIRVDVDNLEDVLRRFAPRLKLALTGADEPVELEFRTFDDFRPESLYRRIPQIQKLHGIRARLDDSEQFEAAAAELRSLLGTETLEAGAARDASKKTETTPAQSESDSETIARLLGKPATATPDAGARQRAQTAVSELIKRAVEPHVESERPSRAGVYLTAIEEAVAEHMRSLLHAPAFQALESAWLSLHQLVSNLETDEELQVHVLDISRPEIESDLASAGGNLKASGLYRLLVERTGPGTPGGEPWSLLLGNFELGPEPSDLGLLAALGLTGASAGGPFIAAANPGLLGCRSLADTPDPSDWTDLAPDAAAAWNALRQSPIAPWIGLAAPRLLLRLPYGRDSEPVDDLEFEEMSPARRHEDYLWGNPAFGCGLLIGQAYRARGWSMAPGDVLDLGDLPAHVYEQEGETRLQPCAEALLTERAAEVMLARGIMPLLSFKGRNLVRLARFQSIASPPAALMGSWRG